MRNTRLVTLRSSLPTGLVTLHHDVPEYLRASQPDVAAAAERSSAVNDQNTESSDVQPDATPKVEKTRVATQVRIETAARRGN